MSRRVNIVGQRFGRLVVIRKTNVKGGNGYYRECQCDCGNMVLAMPYALKSGHTKSCGCYNLEKLLEHVKTHGMSGTPTYITWKSMRKRCHNPSKKEKAWYGDREIKCCPQWDDFEQFLADMGDRPEGMSLDRIDNDGDYTPENCRWATPRQQANNRRSNIVLDYKGKSLTLKQWSMELDLNYGTLYSRHRAGWSTRDILESRTWERRKNK